ncbi:helix-turn-helix domain-containing protein, partial [Sediminibacterium sp.]|uniref:helix-turn-helix domain-containing protein n=1 Tax=Sediminibacterium sp. TaxID=1917865 RepID=UPI003F711A53
QSLKLTSFFPLTLTKNGQLFGGAYNCYVNKEEKRYKTELKQFGQRLREIREKNNLTQLQLEVMTSIDRSEISRIENGLRNIEFYTIVKLSVALETSISDFFSEK